MFTFLYLHDQGEIFMKKLVTLALAALIVLPTLALSGCACDNGYGKAHQHHGGKM